jgi:hypothetical protein
MTLLRLGQSKAGSIINATKLQSSTVYHLLGSLAEKGVISHVTKGRIRHYQATNPESLLSLMDERKSQIESVIPVLKAMENTEKDKQSSRAYEGLNGLRSAVNDILVTLKPGDDYCFFQMPKEGFFNSNVVSLLRGFQMKRAAKGIRVRGLAMHENRSIVWKIFRGLKHSEIRYLDEFTPNSIIVYANKILMLDWNNLNQISAFVIESRTFSDTYRKFFDQKWRAASN